MAPKKKRSTVPKRTKLICFELEVLVALNNLCKILTDNVQQKVNSTADLRRFPVPHSDILMPIWEDLKLHSPFPFLLDTNWVKVRLLRFDSGKDKELHRNGNGSEANKRLIDVNGILSISIVLGYEGRLFTNFGRSFVYSQKEEGKERDMMEKLIKLVEDTFGGLLQILRPGVKSNQAVKQFVTLINNEATARRLPCPSPFPDIGCGIGTQPALQKQYLGTANNSGDFEILEGLTLGIWLSMEFQYQMEGREIQRRIIHGDTILVRGPNTGAIPISQWTFIAAPRLLIQNNAQSVNDCLLQQPQPIEQVQGYSGVNLHPVSLPVVPTTPSATSASTLSTSSSYASALFSHDNSTNSIDWSTESIFSSTRNPTTNATEGSFEIASSNDTFFSLDPQDLGSFQQPFSQQILDELEKLKSTINVLIERSEKEETTKKEKLFPQRLSFAMKKKKAVPKTPAKTITNILRDARIKERIEEMETKQNPQPFRRPTPNK